MFSPQYAVPWRDKVIQHFPESDLFSGRKLFNIRVQESLYSCIINPLSSEVQGWFYFWEEGNPPTLSLWAFSFLENIYYKCFFWKCIQTTQNFRLCEVLYLGFSWFWLRKRVNFLLSSWYNVVFWIQNARKLQLWGFATTSNLVGRFCL